MYLVDLAEKGRKFGWWVRAWFGGRRLQKADCLQRGHVRVVPGVVRSGRSEWAPASAR